VVLLLSLFALFGLWVSRGRVESVEDLLTARGSTGERRTTATLVASVMGVWILLSAPEAGVGFGVAAAVGYAVGEGLPMAAYARLGPRIRAVVPDGHSLTEYAHARYGAWMYGFVVAVSVLYMFIFVAAELTGIALALSLVAGVPQWQTALLVGGFVLLYTAYGGLRASILTDTVQAIVMVPLLAVAAAAAVFAAGGPGTVLEGVRATNPALLDPTAADGLRFGAALALAIFGAELLNQTWWQRVYAADSDRTTVRGFRNAAALNASIVFLAVLLGVVAVGATTVENPSTAFFALVGAAFPDWLVLAVTLLALLLVMSSVDTLFNAISSLLTADLARLLPDPGERALLGGARLVTVAIAVAAVYVSLRAQSVLALFLFADLLGAAVAFPLVYGLYSGRLRGPAALVGALSGLVVGAAYFPFPLGIGGALRSLPVVGGLLPAPDPLYLTAFAGAAGASVAVTLALARLFPGRTDLDRLSEEVTRLDTADPGDD